MSRYYANYGQYLGAQRCCDARGEGPQGPAGPTGPSAIGQRGYTGPAGASVTGPTGPAGPVGKMTSMIGGLVTTPPTNAISYFGAYAGSYDLSSSLTEDNAVTIIPFNSIISNLYINLSAAPGTTGSGTGYSFTIRKTTDTGIPTDTGITVTISEAATSGSNTTNAYNFSAGDRFTIQCGPIGPPASVSIRWSCQITSII